MANAIEMAKQGWIDEGRKETIEECIKAMGKKEKHMKPELIERTSYIEGYNAHRSEAIKHLEELK